MINIEALVCNLKKYALFEESFSDIDSTVDNGRKQRGMGLTAYYTGITRTNDDNVRTHWKVPSQNDPKVQYDVTVDIIVPDGGLFAWAKRKWNPREFKDILTKSDVRIHCSCPDFYWSGMAHNNIQNNTYASDGTRSIVLNAQANPSDPIIRDPNHQLKSCKHLHRVFTLFPTNAFNIMSDVRKFKLLSAKPEELSPTEELNGKTEATLSPIDESDKKPILDSLYSAAEQINEQTEQNAENMLSDENKNNETAEEINDNISNEEPEISNETQEAVPEVNKNLIDDVMNTESDEDKEKSEVSNDDVQDIIAGENSEENNTDKKNMHNL